MFRKFVTNPNVRRAFKPSVSSLFTPSRGFMTFEQYQKHVPEHLRVAYEGAMKGTTDPTTQREGVGECHFIAEKVGKLVQTRLDATAKPSAKAKRIKTSSQWTRRNEQAARSGRTAVVRGHGTETPESEWANQQSSTGHAVTVLGPTTDGNGFVVHDPDTTHHPLAKGSKHPGANLRVMSSKQLASVRQVTVGDPQDANGTSSLPVVEQHAPGLFNKVLGFMGFGK